MYKLEAVHRVTGERVLLATKLTRAEAYAIFPRLRRENDPKVWNLVRTTDLDITTKRTDDHGQ